MARKITLTEAQKAREARVNALMNRKVQSDVPPIQLKVPRIPDPNAEREVRAEAKAS